MDVGFFLDEDAPAASSPRFDDAHGDAARERRELSRLLTSTPGDVFTQQVEAAALEAAKTLSAGLDEAGRCAHVADALGKRGFALDVLDLRVSAPEEGSSAGRAPLYLPHTFCRCQRAASGNSDLIVDPGFRAQFAVVRPSPEFAQLLEDVPATFVGTLEHLEAVVKFVAACMQSSFKDHGMALPPWRTARALLSKWVRPECDAGEQQAEQQQRVDASSAATSSDAAGNWTKPAVARGQLHADLTVKVTGSSQRTRVSPRCILDAQLSPPEAQPRLAGGGSLAPAQPPSRASGGLAELIKRRREA
mmetsp:Transcript_9891/g.32400  ORF Transcript_9891/g.32400 Transcript_9891/m.32400 type:complete len:305 (-) Transcript_9891:157-1071(-)